MNTNLVTILFIAISMSTVTLLRASGQDTITNTLGMSFTAIPAGSFIMGTKNLDEAAAAMPSGTSLGEIDLIIKVNPV